MTVQQGLGMAGATPARFTLSFLADQLNVHVHRPGPVVASGGGARNPMRVGPGRPPYDPGRALRWHARAKSRKLPPVPETGHHPGVGGLGEVG
jgi:hypothetical protein